MAVASSLDQLKVVVWKNFIIKKRNRGKTLAEVLFPIILVAILAIVRTSVKDDVHDVEPSYPSEDIPRFADIMALKGALMYAPNDDPNVNTIINDLKALTAGSKVQHPFLGFKDGAALDDFVKKNTTDPKELPLWAGVVFDNPGALDTANGSRDMNLIYELRFNASDIPDTSSSEADILRDEQVSGGSTGTDKYRKAGFLTLQQEVDIAIMNLIGGNAQDARLGVKLQRYPTPRWSSNAFQQAVSQIISFFLVIAFAISLRFLVNNLVTEKEKKIKEGMKIMGMKHWIFWASWWITSFLTLAFTVTVVSATFKLGKIFSYSNFFVLEIFYLLFAMSTIGYACFISTLFNKARTASIVAMLTFYISSVPAVILKGRKGSNGIRLILSLLSPSAFSFGTDLTSRLEQDKVGVTWSNLSEGSDEDLAMSTIMLMLLVDTCLYLLLAWYLDNVMPGEYGTGKSYFFFLSPSYWSKSKKAADDTGLPLTTVSTAENGDGESYEAVAPEVAERIGVSIRSLRKEYKAQPKNVLAVDGLNLDMYKDQVTVVLGHNGAGKTSTLSMLTGLFGPTGGDAWVLGKSITHSIDEVRQNIGICPQHDILFDDLTVYEHLVLFGLLKGIAKGDVEREVEKKMSEVGLTEKKHVLTKALSGGMKRKLSVAIAFIGESQVVFLDEPCSGIDAYTRRLIWSLVEKNKKDKVIVLTTHSMDEADLLGDRIAIMSKGKLRCAGSSMFLKSRFGIGYNMTMVKEPGCDEAKVTSFVQERIPEAKMLNSSGAELAYVLPLGAVKQFSSLFSDLDDNSESLKLNSYGISVTTLEEVFLRIAQEEEAEAPEPEGFGPDGPGGDAAHTGSVQASSDLKLTPKTSLLGSGDGHRERTSKQQMKALFVKRAKVAKRDKKGAYMQIAAPIFFLLLSAVAMKIQGDSNNHDGPSYDVIDVGAPYNSTIPWSIDGALSVNTGNSWMNDMANDYIGQDPKYYKTVALMQSGSLTQQELGDQGSDLPGGGYIFDDDMLLPSFNYTHFFNPFLLHSAPAYINMMNNQIANSRVKGQSISVVNSPLPKRYGQPSNDLAGQIGASIMAIYTTMAFSFIPAIVAAIVVRERETKARHQQLVSGIKVWLYWFATFVWDFAMYLIPCVVTIIIMIAFQQKAFLGLRLAAVFILLVLSGLAILPMTYFLSFFFKKHTNAQVGLLLVFMFVSLVGIIISFVFTFIGETNPTFKNVEKLIKYPFFFLPNYAVGKGLMSVVFQYITDETFSQINPDYKRKSVLEWNQLGAPFVFLLGEIFLYWAMVWWQEKRLATGAVLDNDALIANEEDEDVVKERARIESQFEHGDRKGPVTDDNVKLVKLRKVFPPTTSDSPPKVAVNSLSCGIGRNEVFGLLGPNGAGKTTSLSILSGEIDPSAGTAYLGGLEITREKTKIYDQLGFCPQADALIDLMTCRELLTMYARIKGLREESIPAAVENKIVEVGLTPHANKLSKDLSGGNKRKLSLAIACIGDPNILFLDEPSTGMDPMARRHMWDVISAYRHGRSVILTTHSLEEADALCTRIGIMVNGELKCLGSAQHLKDRFGRGYLMEIAADTNRAEEVKTFIADKFPESVLVEWHGGHLKYELPKTGLTLSAVFNLVENHRSKVGILDYSISQPTLEQIFIQFARQQEDEV